MMGSLRPSAGRMADSWKWISSIITPRFGRLFFRFLNVHLSHSSVSEHLKPQLSLLLWKCSNLWECHCELLQGARPAETVIRGQISRLIHSLTQYLPWMCCWIMLAESMLTDRWAAGSGCLLLHGPSSPKTHHHCSERPFDTMKPAGWSLGGMFGGMHTLGMSPCVKSTKRDSPLRQRICLSFMSRRC